jgi:hypothetical protein
MLTLKILILISRPTDIATKGQMKRDFDKWFPVPQGESHSKLEDK